MEIATPSSPSTLRKNSTIQVASTIDNPSYFHDPYAKLTGRDASGFVLGGLLRAAKFPSKRDPVVVWLVQPDADAEGSYRRRKVFQDDGRRISTASTAVVVAVDPRGNGGRKQVCDFFWGVRVLEVRLTLR